MAHPQTPQRTKTRVFVLTWFEAYGCLLSCIRTGECTDLCMSGCMAAWLHMQCMARRCVTAIASRHTLLHNKVPSTADGSIQAQLGSHFGPAWGPFPYVPRPLKWQVLRFTLICLTPHLTHSAFHAISTLKITTCPGPPTHGFVLPVLTPSGTSSAWTLARSSVDHGRSLLIRRGLLLGSLDGS